MSQFWVVVFVAKCLPLPLLLLLLLFANLANERNRKHFQLALRFKLYVP